MCIYHQPLLLELYLPDFLVYETELSVKTLRSPIFKLSRVLWRKSNAKFCHTKDIEITYIIIYNFSFSRVMQSNVQ